MAERKARDGEVHALDMGAGTGVLAMLAAQAGARNVVACDLHESLCDVARKASDVELVLVDCLHIVNPSQIITLGQAHNGTENYFSVEHLKVPSAATAVQAVAANGLSDRVSVVHRDAGLLQRGREVRALGVNLVVTDMFDAGEETRNTPSGTVEPYQIWPGSGSECMAVPWVMGPGRVEVVTLDSCGAEPPETACVFAANAGLFGDGHALLTELARKRVMQPGATMVPAAATVYCMGVEALTGLVSGFDMSSINTYR